jgi:hypothetical protein
MRQTSGSDASLLEAFFPKANSGADAPQIPPRNSTSRWRAESSVSPGSLGALSDGTQSDNASDHGPQTCDFYFRADELSTGLWALDPQVALELKQLDRLGRARGSLGTGWLGLWRAAAFGGLLWLGAWPAFVSGPDAQWSDWSAHAVPLVCWSNWACLATLGFFASGALASWRAHDAERGLLPGVPAVSPAAAHAQQAKVDFDRAGLSPLPVPRLKPGRRLAGAVRSCRARVAGGWVAVGPALFAVALTATSLAAVGFWALVWPALPPDARACSVASGCAALSGGGALLLLLVDGGVNQLHLHAAQHFKWCLAWPAAWALVQVGWVRSLGFASCCRGTALPFQTWWRALVAVGGGLAVVSAVFFVGRALLRWKGPRDAADCRAGSGP